MYVLRPIETRDEEAFIKLALTSKGKILTLPANPVRLQQKFQEALKSFSSSTPPNSRDKYLFLLENLETKAIEGCSAIYAKSGIQELGCYKMDTLHFENCTIEQIPAEQKILAPVLLPKNASEVGSLFLSKSCRKEGLGKLLSLSRFLFIGCHPERFQKLIISEIRGIIDASDRSPFWEGLGRHFCNLDFRAITELCEAKPSLSKEILPHYPIYLSLLPPEVQEVIGKTHANAAPALKMLLQEGFSIFNAVDIFDGGPKLEAQTDEIKTIRTATHTFVKAITTRLNNGAKGLKLIGKNKLAFRACYGDLKMKDPEEGATLSMATAKALEIDVGKKICFIEINSHKEP